MRSGGTPLAGRYGISRLWDGSSWCCIIKCDALSWFDLTGFCTTVRVSKQKKIMFEGSSKSRMSGNGRKINWQCFPDVSSNGWKRFWGCHGGRTWVTNIARREKIHMTDWWLIFVPYNSLYILQTIISILLTRQAKQSSGKKQFTRTNWRNYPTTSDSGINWNYIKGVPTTPSWSGWHCGEGSTRISLDNIP